MKNEAPYLFVIGHQVTPPALCEHALNKLLTSIMTSSADVDWSSQMHNNPPSYLQDVHQVSQQVVLAVGSTDQLIVQRYYLELMRHAEHRITVLELHKYC